jgi:hypothetical protein
MRRMHLQKSRRKQEQAFVAGLELVLEEMKVLVEICRHGGPTERAVAVVRAAKAVGAPTPPRTTPSNPRTPSGSPPA